MIKHSEIKNHIDLSMMNRRITNGLYLALEQYIAEQEKKDELLKLYKECYDEGYFWPEIQQRIKALEEELK